MIDKSDIKQWAANSNYFLWQEDEDKFVKIADHCFNDLQPQWVSTGSGDSLVDNQLYWVLMHNGMVDKMYFNNYLRLGGRENYWQTLSGEDIPIEGTKYIESFSQNHPNKQKPAYRREE